MSELSNQEIATVIWECVDSFDDASHDLQMAAGENYSDVQSATAGAVEAQYRIVTAENRELTASTLLDADGNDTNDSLLYRFAGLQHRLIAQDATADALHKAGSALQLLAGSRQKVASAYERVADAMPLSLAEDEDTAKGMDEAGRVEAFIIGAETATSQAVDALPVAKSVLSQDYQKPIELLDQAIANATEGDSLLNSATFYLDDYAEDIGDMTGGEYRSSISYPNRMDADEPRIAEAYGHPVPNAADRLMGEILGKYVDAYVDADETAGVTFEQWFAYMGKSLKGPQAGLIEDQLQKFKDAATAVSPDLQPRHFQPDAYMDERTRTERMGILKSDIRAEFCALVDNKNNYMLPVSRATLKMDRDVVAKDIFAHPRYEAARDEKACVLACYNMIYGDITGQAPQERLERARLRDTFGTPIVGHEPLLNILESPTFEERTGHSARTISFTSMTLGKLVDIADRLKNSDPDRDVHLATYIQTALAANRNIWHCVVVTSITKDTVIYHDPSRSRGADVVVPKEDFYKRWGVAYNSGFMVVSK